MSRLIFIANRLPVKIAKEKDNINFHPSVGGLATGLSSFCRTHQAQAQWVGWPGLPSDNISNEQKEHITKGLAEYDSNPVFLTEDDMNKFYYGFCNKTIWPLFHYFPETTVYEPLYWQRYKEINRRYCDAVMKIAKPDDLIWVHDYQLMLLPRLIRDFLPKAQIGFFLHIPFPSFELFRCLPWRNELLDGLLGADLVGFHAYDYVRHFLSSVARIKGTEHSMGSLTIGDRVVKVDAFPMGIDYQKYFGAAQNKEVIRNMKEIRQEVGERKTIISIDRLDYTKGIIQRLEALDLFLTQNPRYKEKVTMILLAVPSRTAVSDYIELREELEHLIGRINGEHGVIGWVPVWYLYRALPFERLSALYNIADVALVTPLRDGMNLIAKEFVASKSNGKGIIILSEMAGAASELGEAVIVNSYNKAEIVAAIKQALDMPENEQIERNRLMQQRLSRYNITRWANDFIYSLKDVKNIQKKLTVRRLTTKAADTLFEKYKNSTKRLIMLDYDGTLVGFSDRPERARPDKKMLSTLEILAKKPENEIVIISGRDKDTLSKWFGNLNLSLIAEHGARVKHKNNDWQVIEPLSNEWKQTIKPILDMYEDRTPGSYVEEKDFSLVWHFRRSDPDLAYVRTQELRDAVLNLTENLDIGVFEGSKILEIKNIGISKGQAAKMWLNRENWDFILAAGDDYTDEDLFAVLSANDYSIKIGHGLSKARYSLDSVEEMRKLIDNLANI